MTFVQFVSGVHVGNYCVETRWVATESHLGSVLDDVHDVRVPDSKHNTERGLISLMTKHELTYDRVGG